MLIETRLILLQTLVHFLKGLFNLFDAFDSVHIVHVDINQDKRDRIRYGSVHF